MRHRTRSDAPCCPVRTACSSWKASQYDTFAEGMVSASQGRRLRRLQHCARRPCDSTGSRENTSDSASSGSDSSAGPAAHAAMDGGTPTLGKASLNWRLEGWRCGEGLL